MKILAITGGSGSGKSTVLRALADHLGPRASMLSLDDYYRPKEELPVDGNGETNFDVPEAIDHVALHRDILKLGRGEQVSFQSYTYNKDLMTSELTVVEPREWLIVEGLFVMRLARRKDRDLNVRGYAPEEVDYQWKHHVSPAYSAHIEPHQAQCDVVIDNDHDWTPGLKQLIEHLEALDAS